MNSIEDEILLDMGWIVSLGNKVSNTKFRDKERKPTIYRVPDILKKVDPQAYEPLLVSLGPYHHDKPHLQAMNQLKWKYLKFVLEQNSGVALVDYVDQIKRLETQARDAYSEEVKMSSNSFVEMMLLDGCFVMLTKMEWNTKMDISEKSTLLTQFEVVQDISMLENQLPFFLLDSLYKSAFPDGRPFRNLTFEFIRMHTLSYTEYPSSDETFHHIIHLLHSCIDPKREYYGDDNLLSGWLASLIRPFKLDKLCSSLCTVRDDKSENLHEAKPDFQIVDFYFPWIPSATLLNEAGILFEIKKRAKSFLDITFHNGKLQIPQLHIDDITNSVLRNLIAYEQCSMTTKFPVSSYAKLMDYLINTTQDVELLQKLEIIISSLGEGDSQVVATLFNKHPMHVVGQWNNAYFFGDIEAMLKQRNTRYSKWLTILNRDYFNNRWAVISLFQSCLLFVLTMTQTIYGILSYDRPTN